MKPTDPKVKETVSDTFRQNDTVIDNFQLENMRHKMNRIKEAKKKKKSTNYKKIETFETLSNDASPPLREGFDKDDYEGHDNVKEPDTRNLQFNLTDKIEYVYEAITSINTTIATYITEALSGGRSNEKDMLEIRNYISWVESVGISTYIVYNWYFLMYYAKENSIELPDISREYFKANKTATNTLILWFLEYAIIYPELMNWLLIDIIPSKVGVYLNGAINFSLLYVAIVLGVKYFAVGFKEFFTASLSFDITGGGIRTYMIMFVILQYIYTLIADTIKDGSFPTSATGVAGMFIYHMIRLCMILFISLPFGGIFSCAYLLFNSFFAIMMYNPRTTYDVLDLHATRPSPISLDPCEDGGLMKWLKIVFLFIAQFFTNIKRHLFWIVLLLVVFISTSSLYSNLSDVRSFMPGILFRDVVGIYNIVTLFVILSILYSRIFSNPVYGDRDTRA